MADDKEKGKECGSGKKGKECGEKEKDCGEKKKLKPCCACPETKQVRDKCIIENGEESCMKEIAAHKECMKKMGFNV